MIAPIMCCGGTAVRSECPYHKDVEPGTFQKAEPVTLKSAEAAVVRYAAAAINATRDAKTSMPEPVKVGEAETAQFRSWAMSPCEPADDGFETRTDSYWAVSAPVDITPRPAPDPTDMDPMQTMVFDVGQPVRLKAHPSDTGRIVSIDRMNCTMTIQPDSNLPFDTVKNHCSLWEPVAAPATDKFLADPNTQMGRVGSYTQMYCEPPRSRDGIFSVNREPATDRHAGFRVLTDVNCPPHTFFAINRDEGIVKSLTYEDVKRTADELMRGEKSDHIFMSPRDYANLVTWSTQEPIIHTFDGLSSHSSCHGLSPDESIVDYLMSHRHVTEMVFAADDYRCLCMAAGDAWGGPRYEVVQGGVNFAGPVGRVKIRPAAE